MTLWPCNGAKLKDIDWSKNVKNAFGKKTFKQNVQHNIAKVRRLDSVSYGLCTSNGGIDRDAFGFPFSF